MRGRVIFWKRDFNNPKKTRFGWGFIAPDGCSGRKDERVYFNEKTASYSPVGSGDLVEFEIYDRHKPEHGRAAFKVEKIDEAQD